MSKTTSTPDAVDNLETRGTSLGPSSNPPMRLVTIRSMAIGCALMPIMALWVVYSELIWYTGHSTAISLFYHVTVTLFALAIVNLWVQSKWPKAALSPGELMTIYVMLSIGGTLCSHDFMQVMIPLIAYPQYAANPQNRWDELILPHLKSWAILTDPEALNGLAVGNASLYKWSILKAWAKPIAFWGSFTFILMFGLLCLNTLLRRQWTEQERLSFPVIQIPLMIAQNLTDLLKNKLFWIAFGIVAVIDIINGFNFFYPNIPQIPIVEAFEFKEYFVERPWDAIASTTINLYPFVIGLTYFLPTDLAFSCWFFFILLRLELVIASALGIRDLPGFPFVNEQAGGGYLGLGLLALWISRHHFIKVAKTILGRPGGLDETQEPVRYRTAFLGFVGSFFLLMYCGHLLGASWGMMFLFFLIFFLYALAIARMRAELGPPAHDLHNMGPDLMLANAFGTRNLSTGNLATFSFFFWFNRAYRAHFSAHSMEGYKSAQICRLVARSMYYAMLLALIIGLLSGFWAMLHALYVHGYSGRQAGDAFSSESWNRFAGWVSLPEDPRNAGTIATFIGLLFTLALGAMRMKFTWWLWHPVGYATAASWSMEKLWACLFLGWLAKLLITRYGGAQAYRKALPFFVGLVLGEFVVGSIWSIFGAVLGIRVYHFWG